MDAFLLAANSPGNRGFLAPAARLPYRPEDVPGFPQPQLSSDRVESDLHGHDLRFGLYHSSENLAAAAGKFVVDRPSGHLTAAESAPADFLEPQPNRGLVGLLFAHRRHHLAV